MNELKPGDPPEIPDIQPDPRNGDNEKRRGGAAAPWGAAGGAGAGVGTPASQLAQWLGLGARASGPLSFLAPVAAFLGSNLGMGLVTMAVVSGSVYGLYSLGMQAVHGPQAQKKHSIFASRENPARPARAARGAGLDSLGYLVGANRGALGDGNPAQQTQAQNSAGQPAEPSAPDAAATAADPGALAKDAEKAAGNPAGSPSEKEALRSTLSGALGNRGAGTGASAGGAGSGLTGAGASAASQNLAGGLDPGRLLAMAQREGAVASARGRASLGRGRTGRGAMGQLRVTNAQSQTAAQMGGASASAYTASQPFDSGSTIGSGGGTSVTGSGAGSGAAGGAGVGSGSEEGGPLGGSGGTSDPQAPSADGVDVTPWSGLVMMAMALLVMASLLIFITGMLGLKIKTLTANMPALWFADPTGYLYYQAFLQIQALKKLQHTLYMVVLGLAAAATLLGVMTATTYGQVGQGGILATGGAITAAVAAMGLWGHVSSATMAWMAVLAGVAGMAAAIGGMLAGGSGIGGA